MERTVAHGFFSHKNSRNGGVNTAQVTAENTTKHGQISFWGHFLRFRFGDDFPNFDFNFLKKRVDQSSLNKKEWKDNNIT